MMQRNKLKQYKILLVDDESSILNSEIRILRKWQKQNNVEILTALSGDDALHIIRNEIESLSLIVSDEKMPGIQGSELLAQVHTEFPDLLSIILTGYSSFDSILEAIKAGVHSYLIKPIEKELFINEIDKVFTLFLLKEENKEYTNRINKELKWAAELQKKLLHVKLPENDSINIDILYQPVVELGCGGDFYDILNLKNKKYLLFVGDVAGHGIKAAFITTIIKQIIQGELVNELDMEKSSTSLILSTLNRLFYNNFSNENNIMVTFSVQLFDCSEMKLSYSNGGHLPFFRLRDKESKKIGNPGITLGFQENIEYSEDIIDMQKGDKYIFLTDGVIEVPGESIFEQIDNLEILLPQLDRDNLLTEMDRHYRKNFPDNLFPDDATLISVEIN